MYANDIVYKEKGSSWSSVRPLENEKIKIQTIWTDAYISARCNWIVMQIPKIPPKSFNDN